MPVDYLVNLYDVIRAAKIAPVVYVGFAPDYTLQSGGIGRKDGWNKWEEVVAATGITEWATCTNRALSGQAWFPATFVDTVAGMTIGEKHTRIKVAVGIPCAALEQGDQWHTSRCGKPATSTGPAQFRGNDAPLCNLHRSIADRVAANDAARRAAWDERDERWRREAEMRQASIEWAARLRDEFGIEADPTDGTAGLRVAVPPETLYRQLVDVAGVLRDMGIDLAEVLAGDEPVAPS